MAGRLTDLANAGLIARLPLSGLELVEVSQDTGLPALQTRVTTVGDIARAVQNIVGEPVVNESPNVGITLHDDFFAVPGAAPAGAIGAYVSAAGGGGGVVQATATNANFGTAELSTGTGALYWTAVLCPKMVLSRANADQKVVLESRVRLVATPTTHDAAVGFAAFDSGELFITDYVAGAFLVANPTQSGGNWRAYAKTTPEPAWFIQDTGINAYDGNWHVLRVEIHSSGLAAFYIDTVLVAAFGINWDLVPLDVLCAYMRKVSAGAGNNIMHLDYATLIGSFIGGGRG